MIPLKSKKSQPRQIRQVLTWWCRGLKVPSNHTREVTILSRIWRHWPLFQLLRQNCLPRTTHRRLSRVEWHVARPPKRSHPQLPDSLRSTKRSGSSAPRRKWPRGQKHHLSPLSSQIKLRRRLAKLMKSRQESVILQFPSLSRLHRTGGTRTASRRRSQTSLPRSTT